MKKLTMLLIGGVLLFTACSTEDSQKNSLKTVKVIRVEARSEIAPLVFPGKVAASSEINLAFRIAGPIAKIHVAEGDFVRKGQVLAEMDSRDYILQFSATQAEYEQIKGEAERVIKLYGQESVSQNDYEKAVSGIQQITAKYNAHKNALSDTKLTAPFDGYIHKRYFDESETIGAGMPLFSLISSGTPEVVINIPAKNFIERDNFDNYHCTFSLYPGVEFPLDLLAINQKANLNQLYAMRLKIRSNQGKQMPTPGMSTIVTINLKPGDSDLLTIPVTSVFEKEGSNCVWVYNGDTQTVQLRPIQLVEITSDGKVVVTEGLQAGDIVVSAGIHTLQDGEKVKLLPEVSATNTGGML